MSIIMGRGESARKAIESGGGGLDLSKAFVRLKVGESIRVRILSDIDYVAYKAHGHFKNGIYTQPCIAVAGERCLLCEAAKYDGELIGKRIETVKNMKGEAVSEWASMYAKKRVLFAFVDLDQSEMRVFDATKNQAETLIQTIEEYKDDLSDMAFTLKRSGEKTETTYTLNPIMPKKMAEVQETFDKFDEEIVPDSLFEEALQARTFEDHSKDLQKAGFPMKEVFDIEVDLSEDTDAGKESLDGSEPITNEDAENAPLPF